MLGNIIRNISVLAVVGVSSPQLASAASTLPNPVFIVSLTTFNSNKSYSSPGSYVLGNLSTTIAGDPGPLLSGRATGAGGDVVDGNGTLESAIGYSFAVDGAPSGVLIPLLVAVTLRVNNVNGPIGSTSDASARFGLNNGAFDVFNILAETSDPTHPNFSGVLGFSQLAGAVGRISLQIDARAIGGGIADAFADPYIFIDPEFLAAHPNYAVIVSPGIGNAPPAVAGVPEPATWAMMVGGLGLVGRTMRYRRRKQQLTYSTV